jgi:hypothetical protein
MMYSEQEIILIARQLSISEGACSMDEQHPASWMTTATEIAAALSVMHPVAKGSQTAVTSGK